MRQKPEEESEKNLFQKILRPENCPGLSKITVNQVIWDRVSAEARAGDVKTQRVQSALVKGTTNVALIADLVLKSSEDKDNIDITALLDKLWKLTKDSLCCLGAANWELVQRRREALKPQISKDYAHLCAQKVKFTDSLFGDDVTKQIKDITDDNKVNDRTEWSLDPSTFELITKKLGQPEIDLFASYSNAKVACYYSWKPDPGAAHVDAFTVSLSGPLTYCFPPFSLLGRCLQKIAMDQAEYIVLVPNWPTQPYYSKVMEMLVSLPLVLPCQPQLLQLPHDPLHRHPLFPKLQLLACKLSENPLRAKTFQGTLPTLSSHLGAQEHRSSIRPISTSGLTTVVKGNLIHFIPL